MQTRHLPLNIRRRARRAMRKLRRINKRIAKRELRCLAVHMPRFLPTSFRVEA